MTRTGFFPGFLDSDGRPWSSHGRTPKNYERGLEAALKIALLTHHHLHVPAGYFLDNPHLQRLFLKFKGDDNESRSFRLLMRDLLRISPQKADHSRESKITKWADVLHAWAIGDGSHRNKNVYLNAVDHPDALAIQRSSDADAFVKAMRQAIEARWKVDVVEFLDLCDQQEFRTAEHGEFPFDSLVRSRLLSGTESFFDFRDSVKDKFLAIADAAATGHVGLSRSMLRNPDFLLEIGVKDYHTLSHAEYQILAPILGHYHHVAFAESLALPGVASNQNPTLETTAKALLRQQLNESQRAAPVCWPLSSISFEDLWQLRLKRNDFSDNLDLVHDATFVSDTEAYSEALNDYARHVAGVLSLDFKDADPKELAAGLDGSVFTDGPSTSKALLEVARFA